MSRTLRLVSVWNKEPWPQRDALNLLVAASRGELAGVILYQNQLLQRVFSIVARATVPVPSVCHKSAFRRWNNYTVSSIKDQIEIMMFLRCWKSCKDDFDLLRHSMESLILFRAVVRIGISCSSKKMHFYWWNNMTIIG